MNDKVPNRIIGFLLLSLGLIIIVYSAYNVYSVFKGQTEPYPLFNFDPVSLDFSQYAEETPSDANLKQELISSDLLSDPANMVAHLMLMGFVASVGFKIASLGVMLVRTIKVNLKEEKESILNPPPNKPTWK